MNKYTFPIFICTDDRPFAVKNAGYKLAFDEQGKPVDLGIVAPHLDPNGIDQLIDSFYDLDNAELCVNPELEYYAVEFNYTVPADNELYAQPMIWQKLTKA